MANKEFMFLTVLPTFTAARAITQADEDAFAANVAALTACPIPYLKAISVVSLAYALRAKPGTDYITAPKMNQLIQDARSLFGALPFLVNEPNQQMVLFRTVCDWNAGYTAATTLSRDPNVLISVFPGLLELAVPVLDQCIFMLRVKLAV